LSGAVNEISVEEGRRLLKSGRARVKTSAQPSVKSRGEEALAEQIARLKLPAPSREFRFARSIGREWRFDFCWPRRKIAVEVEGGFSGKSRHMSNDGYTEDCRKYSEAAILGWCVLRFTTSQVVNGEAIEMIERALNRKSSIRKGAAK
jgi:very-short-patch-repair endonuclease